MSDDGQPTVVSVSRLIARHHVPIFELIADPARQPEWDGNDNLVAPQPDSASGASVTRSR